MKTISRAQRNVHNRCFHPTGIFTEFTQDELEQSIPDRFERIVRLHPHRLAVKTKKHEVTYDLLNRMANRVGHRIRTTGDQRERPIAILLELGVSWIAAMLGVLKSGNWFITLDPSYPHARIASILESSEPLLLVTDGKNLPLARELTKGHIQLANLEEGGAAETDLCVTIPADSMASVLYTSGSTGVPKGVVWTHRTALHHAMFYVNCFHVTPEDRLSSFGSLNTGQTFSNFLGSGLVGAAFCRYNIRRDGLTDVPSWLNESGITIFWMGVPTFRHFARTLDDSKSFPAVRLVRFASDHVTKKDYELFRRHFAPTCIVAHGLSSTEGGFTTIFLADQQTQVKNDFLPIGYPVKDKEILLLDDLGRESSTISTGEIAVRSRYLAAGYWRNPELTRARFVLETSDPDQCIYRTGDLGQRCLDGSLIHLGRIDFQVKIRGFTVDVSEVESALLNSPAVREVIVSGVEDPTGERRLVAYVVPEIVPLSLMALRGFLIERLPEHMIPSVFVILDEFPLNRAGKFDRNALPKPHWAQRTAETTFVAPRNDTETELVVIFRAALGIEQVGVFDDIFELGGDSLTAAQIVARILARFSVEIPISRIFDSPRVADLASTIVAQQGPTGSATRPISVTPDQQEAPLTFAQERLWFLDQLQPNSSTYNILMAFELTGDLKEPALACGIREIIARHEILRTVFRVVDGNPTQIILSKLEPSLPLVDLTAIRAPNDRHSLAAELTRTFARKPFKLEHGPLIRTLLIGLAPHNHILCLCLHHAVFDTISARIFLRELSQLYETYCQYQPSPLGPLKLQYADFAHWQRDQWQQNVPNAGLAYWLEKFTPLPPGLALPTDRVRPANQSSSGARHWFTIGRDLFRSLQALSRQTGATLFMTLLAAYTTLLHCYAGQDDVVVGCPISERTPKETEGLIGFFLNTLPLRTDLSGDPSFVELLARVKATCVAAYSHGEVPFERLVRELGPERDLSRNPLFQVIFSLSLGEELASCAQFPGIEVQTLEIDAGIARFDLAMVVVKEAGKLRGAIEYNSDLFDAPTVGRMAKHFQTLLQSVVHNPHQRISEHSLLTDLERHQLLVEWNDTRTEYPRDRCVHELFEAQVKRIPEATAAVFGDQQMTYRELNSRANQLAHHLRALGVGPDVLVGLMMERSIEMVVGLLGVLKAGGAYVPLDPSYPEARLNFMVQDARITVLVTQAALGIQHLAFSDALSEGQTSRVVYLDQEVSGIAPLCTDNPVNATDPENIAYVVYTSGSTGQPKGIAMRQGALLNLMEWQVARLPRGSRTLQFASFSFDVSFQESFSTWLSGGTLVLTSDALRQNTEELRWLLDDEEIERWFVPFVGLQQVTQTATEQATGLKALRDVITAGEQLQITAPIERWFVERPYCRLHNQYGASETHVVTTYTLGCPVTDESTLPPIGRPIANTLITVVDHRMRLTPFGVPGELLASGAGLARGYLEQPELTAEKFLPAPYGTAAGARVYRTGDLARHLSCGNLEFLGRRDQQVKIRGFRVEPGEIEAVLSLHPKVRETVVVAESAAALVPTPRTACLVGYIIPHQGVPPNATELRAFLMQTLPDYMVPNAFVTLDALPLTPTGKIDRKALPAPEGIRPDVEQIYIPPRSQTEKVLAAIWREVLGLERVGIHDNFFELGGHSLLATQVIARVRAAFELHLALRVLFEAPTIARLAELINTIRWTTKTPGAKPLAGDDDMEEATV